MKNQKQITVVLRAKSAIRLLQNAQLSVNAASSLGPVNITCTSRYRSMSTGAVMPGDLCMEVRGTANDLDEALEPFANAALTLLPLFTLSANAATDEAEIEYGFDHTPGLTQRDYFQTYIPPEPEVVHVGRNMNLQATVALMSAIDKHPDSERLARGANQYREALLSWRLGRESLCLAHLWMAVEAITKVRLRAECIKQGLSDEADLAKKLGVDKKQLDGIIRKDLILRGDKDCYDKARQASDGFEHGFLEYGKIRELSTDVRHRMAAYVRAAILELCGLDAEVLKTLTTDPYDKPLGYWPLAKYLRGTLIGATDSFPAPGNAHPFIEWNPVVKSSKLNADGTLECEITENLKVKTPDGTGYQQKSLEVWEPG